MWSTFYNISMEIMCNPSYTCHAPIISSHAWYGVPKYTINDMCRDTLLARSLIMRRITLVNKNLDMWEYNWDLDKFVLVRSTHIFG